MTCLATTKFVITENINKTEQNRYHEISIPLCNSVKIYYLKYMALTIQALMVAFIRGQTCLKNEDLII